MSDVVPRYDVLAGARRLSVWDAPGDAAAPTLVFLHAFGASGGLWARTVETLGGAARCVAPDLPGWGSSERVEVNRMDVRYTVRDMADATAALVNALGIERWALVGHSMGGKAALALAARRPPGLESLVLVAPSPPTPEPMGDETRDTLRGSWGQRVAVEKLLLGVSRVARAPADAAQRVQVACAVTDHLRASSGAWDAWLDHGSREDVSDLASRIAVPTLVVAGSDDTALGADVQRRETVARVPGARLAVVPDAAHFVPLDAPDALAARIRAHVLGG